VYWNQSSKSFNVVIESATAEDFFGYDPKTKKRVTWTNGETRTGDTVYVTSGTSSLDGAFAAVGTDTGAIHIIATDSSRKGVTLHPTHEIITALAFSPKNDLFVAAWNDHGNAVVHVYETGLNPGLPLKDVDESAQPRVPAMPHDEPTSRPSQSGETSVRCLIREQCKSPRRQGPHD
jgi:WD40 repeat protein